jgi:hypothetical protein
VDDILGLLLIELKFQWVDEAICNICGAISKIDNQNSDIINEADIHNDIPIPSLDGSSRHR